MAQQKGKRKRLGDLLIENDLISPEQLELALDKQKGTGKRLGQILVELGFLSEDDMISFLGKQWNIPYVKLSNYLIDTEILKLIPEEVARKYTCIPLYKQAGSLVTAMADPLDIFAIDDIQKKIDMNIEAVVGTRNDIISAIDQYYGSGSEMKELISEIDSSYSTSLEAKKTTGKIVVLEEDNEEAPVIKLVNMILMQAIKDGASDIHIEPDDDMLRIRLRIDGILYEIPAPPRHLQGPILSRLKVMAKLDIAERRVPQDGRFQVDMNDKIIDFRVSTFPTIYGENIVMRILDSSNLVVNMNELGFTPKDQNRFIDVLGSAYGIILVTGPTGSGKTTTLYTSLKFLNSIDKNIITVEDPVEYRLPLIRQTQVNPEANFTFAVGLRAILRQDPDIIMVGEVRDRETAEIAIESALTGHLVLSSLHTNDCVGAITRLLNMNIESFLIGSSVVGVVAQRLVRRICSNCKAPYEANDTVKEKIGFPLDKKLILYKGQGCSKCKMSGYKGRAAIFELMTISEELKELIIEQAPISKISKAAKRDGMKTLVEDGLIKAVKGITTLDEVFRVAHSI